MAMTAEAPALIGSSGDSLREAFGKTLSALADEFPKLVVLDADIAGGTGAHHFRKSHPDRFLQFGIAEQNMMAAAGGLAAVGHIPVVTTFAVFCLRAIEQARLSLAYARRNVKIVGSHPGLDVGPDGGSAQALEDMAAFRAIPGMTVISPADPIEMALATRAILEFEGPVYMRTGRSPATRIFGEDHRFEIGKGRVLREGFDVTLVACGVEVALEQPLRRTQPASRRSLRAGRGLCRSRSDDLHQKSVWPGCGRCACRPALRIPGWRAWRAPSRSDRPAKSPSFREL